MIYSIKFTYHVLCIQLISVTQKKTLSAPFVLPFYEFQTHFHELSDVNPNKILLLLQK